MWDYHQNATKCARIWNSAMHYGKVQNSVIQYGKCEETLTITNVGNHYQKFVV